MKFFLLLSLTFVVANGFYTGPGEITAETFDDFRKLGRIASGWAPKKGIFLDFCYISINFYQKQQTCGCVIADEQFVVTTARCVVDCSEKTASNVTVTFPQKSGKDAVVGVRKIIIPDGNGGLPKYDETMEVPSDKIVGGNVALLQLETKIVFDSKTVNVAEYLPQAQVATITDALTYIYQLLPNAKFHACGVGIINNQKDKPKGFLCTEVNVIDPSTGKCKPPAGPATDPYTVPEGVFCLQWPDRDNNMCVGDFGGPIYLTDTNEKGEISLYIPVGLAIGSPDLRKSAPCLDGHTVYVQAFRGAELKWILDTIAGTGNNSGGGKLRKNQPVPSDYFEKIKNKQEEAQKNQN